MTDAIEGLNKRRELNFGSLDPQSRPAQSASEVLAKLAGMIGVSVKDEETLIVEYDLSQIALVDILAALDASGLHLGNRLIHKFKRALYIYTEETQRANLDSLKRGPTNSTGKAFAASYWRRDHGCRDERPTHWRRYL